MGDATASFGYVSSFNKTDGRILWSTFFKDELSRVNAIAVDSSSSDLFVCGYLQPSEATETTDWDSSMLITSVLAKMNMQGGAVSWLIEGTGSNPDWNGATINNQDMC